MSSPDNAQSTPGRHQLPSPLDGARQLSADMAAAPQAALSPNVNVNDTGGLAGDDLREAITTRLRGILECTALSCAPREPQALVQCIHASARECAETLERLRITMELERSTVRRLERELSHAHAALARAQLDFENSHAGELHARHQALHDDLTSLPNRRQCRERLDETLALAAARHTTAALLFLDLDGFKAINDQHGHETGDEVLRIVAARLSRAVRAGDIVGRMGGDEFVCLPSGPLGAAQLALLANKLFDVVSAPLTVGNLRLEVRPSIGVACFPVHASNTGALLRVADAAMYRAKQQRTGVAFAAGLTDVELPLN